VLLAGRRKLLTIVGNGVRFRAVVRAAALGPAADGQLGLMVIGRPVGEVGGQVRSFVVAELITGGVLLALLALGGGALIGRGLEPLGRMARTADGISSGQDLDARMPGAGGRTEVGRLSGAINTMLDRLQQAFAARLRSESKVREFAADASHELRTPLTTIRGYAELYRQGALGPDELPDAMRRIEQEAQRMSTLVAELLELARLDRPTSLDLAETDLTAVVRDAVADATAVDMQRPVSADAPEQLIAVVDERRIRQVLANLLGNVRAHTPPETPVVVRLAAQQAAEGGGVLIEVADRGPGMPAVDAARAFDRFHRATRPEGTPGRDGEAAADRSSGSGLGLSIVQAIAHAHGGQATLESAPGQGTRVLVYLPSPAASSADDGVGRLLNM
jgi:two-component system OmpR family sensor kinase